MSFHLYDIDEIYSNASGTVQFIELHTDFSGQNFFNGHQITSSKTGGGGSNSFGFNHDLVGHSTANSFVLIATQGFVDLGIVTPDFIVPNGFLFDSGTIVFGSDELPIPDTVTYSGLTSHGAHSITRTGADQVASPTNFAGQSGEITVNHAPALSTPLVDKVIGAGQAFSYKFVASTFVDEDADHLSYTATVGGGALPAWLSFASGTRLFSGTPGSTDTGSKTVTVTASDGNGGTAFDTFVVKVISGNVINGTANADVLEGGTKADSITGAGAADTITGGLGNDTINGGTGVDSINGGGGVDTIFPGVGADRVNGGGGADKFVFVEAPSKDILQQFQGGIDVIQLENSVYTAFEATGQLTADNLQTGTTAQIGAASGDGNDFIKYDTDTGKLYYDADGSGGGAALLIATVNSGGTFDPAIDVFII